MPSNPEGPFNLKYFVESALSGAVCCGVTHAAITPIDVVKTRIQLEPTVFRNGMFNAFSTIVRQEGLRGLTTGMGPSVAGYIAQGWFKFGGVELFKIKAAEYVGERQAFKHQTAIYLSTAAAAEFIADIFLCPLEATRIRLVSNPQYANSIFSAMSRIVRTDGFLSGFYAGFGPILMRQIPYTMTQFTVQGFTSDQMYVSAGIQPAEATEAQLLGISLTSGVIAGLAAAIVSHPADNLLSLINKPGAGGNGSTISRLMTLTRDTGLKNLFTVGLGPRCVMIGLLSAGQFVVYDAIMSATGVQKFHFHDPDAQTI
ncbi:mitochondrial carrier family [Globomyces pollinis-pini]|nr:mitochondrial carrier family [Globomyces pollinis-pini]